MIYSTRKLRTLCFGISLFTLSFCEAGYAQTVDITANPTTTTNAVFGTNLYAVNESIYTETEIGASNFTTALSPINQLGFHFTKIGTPTTFGNVTIWMKNVAAETTTLASGTYSSAGYTQVFTGSVTATDTGWITIPLSTPFQRVTGNNLEILVERSDAVSHAGYEYASAGGNNTGTTAASSSRYNGATPLSATTALSASAFRAQLRLEYISPLPVSLTAFSILGSGKTNQLNWTTSTELNTRLFIIERSNDGHSYSAIGEVAAQGNGAIAKTYRFVDETPFAGISYYRLRIVDIDNSSRYSMIRSSRSEQLSRIFLYPNPSKDILNIKIDADHSGKAQLVFRDITGRQVYNKNISVLEGANLVPVSIDAFPTGSYFVQIVMGGKLTVEQFNKD